MQWSAILRPRRIAVAVSIFAVLATGTVLAAGLAGHAGPPAGPLPGRFHMAEARVGDRGSYAWDRVVVGEDGQAAVAETHAAWGFEWLAPQVVRDREGLTHATGTLQQWRWSQDHQGHWRREDPGWTFSIDADSQALVAQASVDNRTWDGGYEVGARSTRSVEYFTPGHGYRGRVLCGPSSPLQGQDVPLDRDVDLLAGCGLGGNAAAEAPFAALAGPFHAAGTQTLDGRETILFSRDPGLAWLGLSRPAVHVWYDRALPVPVRLAVQDPDVPGAYDVYRLTRFARGTEPATWTGPVPSAPAPDWVVAPLVDKLPSEAGLEHPFSAHTALEAASHNASAAPFFQVLGRGYMGRFYLIQWSEHQDASLFSRNIDWVFEANDGAFQANLTVRQQTYTSFPILPGPLLPLLPPGWSANSTDTSVYVMGGPAFREESLRPDQVPKAVPTVASQLARWRAFASPALAGQPRTAWGYQATSGTLWAGTLADRQWSNSTQTPLPTDPLQRADVDQRSRLDADLDPAGRLFLEESTDWTHTDDAGGTQPAAQARASQIAVATSSQWVAPGISVAAGAGLGAVLAALAYLFWPALKSGAFMGLFSRVQSREGLLQHPVRQALLQLVEAEPGIHLREAERRLGLGRNQLMHHMTKLRISGALRVAAGPGYTCLFAHGAADRPLMQAAASLKADAAQRILHAAIRQPGVGARELARLAGLSPGTVSHHLRRLREAGLVAPGGHGILATELGQRAGASAQPA